MSWLAESVDEISDPHDKARFEAGYAVVKDRTPSGLDEFHPDTTHNP